MQLNIKNILQQRINNFLYDVRHSESKDKNKIYTRIVDLENRMALSKNIEYDFSEYCIELNYIIKSL